MAWLTEGMAEAVAVGERVVTWLVAKVFKAVGFHERVVPWIMLEVAETVGGGIEVVGTALLEAGCLVRVRVRVGGGGKIGSVAVGSEVAVAVVVSGARLMKASSPLDRNTITPTSTKPASAPNGIRAATPDQRRNDLRLSDHDAPTAARPHWPQSGPAQ